VQGKHRRLLHDALERWDEESAPAVDEATSCAISSGDLHANVCVTARLAAWRLTGAAVVKSENARHWVHSVEGRDVALSNHTKLTRTHLIAPLLARSKSCSEAGAKESSFLDEDVILVTSPAALTIFRHEVRHRQLRRREDRETGLLANRARVHRDN
jgi:hypothetical protein